MRYFFMRIQSIVIWLGDFSHYCLRQFICRHSLQVASSLSYVTLLSLVPLLGVALSFFGHFTAFENINERTQEFIFNNFIPSFGQIIQEHLISFSAKASQLSIIGIILLTIAAFIMMYTISDALNDIWCVTRRRPLGIRLLVCWAILTLAPVLIGISLYSTSYVSGLFDAERAESVMFIKSILLMLTPIITSALALTIVYIFVPNTHVKWQYAAVAGVTAAVFFEFAKYLFGWYVKAVPTYQIIYGALAVIPMFLIWIYISWVIVLFGAQITYSLSVFKYAKDNDNNVPLRWDFLLAYQLVGELWQAQKQGNGRLAEQLKASGVRHSYVAINTILGQLADACWIRRDDGGRWYLIRDLSELTLFDLYQVLPYKFPDQIGDRENPWQCVLQGVITDGNSRLSAVLAVPLKTTLQQAVD